MESIDPIAWERIIDVNLGGVWHTFRAALPHVKQHHGYLLATSSMAAFVHSPLNGHYTAGKAGVWAMCDSTRLEVRHYGVGVGGNSGGIWKMIDLNTVVDSIATGIERRSNMILPTRQNAIVARIPGLVRPLVDRVGFRSNTVQTAITQAVAH